MKRKITDIKFIVFLTIIFCTMFGIFFYTVNMNNTEILIKASRNLKGVQENTVNSKTTNSSTSSNTSKNTRSQSGNTQKTTNTTSSSNASSTKTTTKSSNADLSNLGIKPNDFSGFTPSKTSYDVTVLADVTEVEVYATAQNSGAKISGTGKQKLQDGKNELSIVVTAESGATKTYTINVTKEGNNGTTETATDEGEGLSSLKLENIELSPEFKTNVYEYTAKYTGDLNKIDVKAVATEPKYVVDITGNDDLKDGENIITILVSDSEGNNVATYQVTLTKSTVDEEALAKEQEEANKKEEQKKVLIIGGVIAILILAIIIYLVIRHRRNSAWVEDYMMPYSSDGDDGFIDENENNYDFKKVNKDEFDFSKREEATNKECEEEPVMSKQEAREMFLSGYDHKEENYEDVRPRKRSKGKRFK